MAKKWLLTSVIQDTNAVVSLKLLITGTNLINVSEEQDMINTTLDDGSSLRQLIIGVNLLLAFQAIRKS